MNRSFAPFHLNGHQHTNEICNRAKWQIERYIDQLYESISHKIQTLRIALFFHLVSFFYLEFDWFKLKVNNVENFEIKMRNEKKNTIAHRFELDLHQSRNSHNFKLFTHYYLEHVCECARYNVLMHILHACHAMCVCIHFHVPLFRSESLIHTFDIISKRKSSLSASFNPSYCRQWRLTLR